MPVGQVLEKRNRLSADEGLLAYLSTIGASLLLFFVRRDVNAFFFFSNCADLSIFYTLKWINSNQAARQLADDLFFSRPGRPYSDAYFFLPVPCQVSAAVTTQGPGT